MAGPLQRLSHTGAAVPSALASSLSVSGMSFVLTQIAGWPTGAGSQPFWVVVEPGTASEEKILCSSQSAGNINVAPSGRGGDGTVAIAHQAGVAVEHIFSALEADDANAHIYDGSRDDHARYAPVNGSRPFTGLVTFNAGITDTGPLTQTGPVAITGNESVSGSLGVGGLTTLSAGLNVTGNETVSGDISGRSLALSGLTGAANATRYVGSTVAGPPTSGAFNLGDYVISQDGAVYVCTTAGSPGTWKSAADRAPRGVVGPKITGPATSSDYTTTTNALSMSVPVVAGRSYVAMGCVRGQQVTNAGSAQFALLETLGGSTSALFWGSLTVSAFVFVTGVHMWVAGVTGSTTLVLQVTCSAAAFRIGANACWMMAEDIGL